MFEHCIEDWHGQSRDLPGRISRCLDGSQVLLIICVAANNLSQCVDTLGQNIGGDSARDQDHTQLVEQS